MADDIVIGANEKIIEAKDQLQQALGLAEQLRDVLAVRALDNAIRSLKYLRVGDCRPKEARR